MAITQADRGDPVVADPVRTAIDAAISGQDPMEAVYGNSGSNSSHSQEDDDSANITPVTPWSPEDNEVEVEEKVSGTPTSSSSKTTVTTPSGDTETVWVRDAKGKKQKLEISYADKTKIREAFLKSAGMRKFQVERDNEAKLRSELEKKAAALEGDLGKLERIYKEQGARGIFETLGGNGAFDQAVEARLKEREHLASLSPEEKMKLQLAESEKRWKNDLDLTKAELAKEREKISQEQEKVAVRSLESKITPAFERYRFKGKLGDDVAEHRLDKAVWRDTMDKLSEYPEDVEITQALIDKEFRLAAADYSRVAKAQTDTSLKQAITKQKDSAAQKAQVIVKKGIASNNVEQDLAKDIKNSNWSSVLQKALFRQ